MSPNAGFPPDHRTLAAFLCRIRGSESGGPTGRHRTTGLDADSPVSPVKSDCTIGLPNDGRQEACPLSPTVRPGRGTDRLAELHDLVIEMGHDLDRAARFGVVPFTGDQLSAYFRDHLRQHGVEAALAEARVRYEAQVLGEVMPLPKAGGSA